MHALKTADHEPGCFIEGEPKASHAHIGNRHLPSFALLEKTGTTLPWLPRKLPDRTQLNRVFCSSTTLLACTNIFSTQSLVAPYTLIGLTALSLLTTITRRTPRLMAPSSTFFEPMMFVWIASNGFCSQVSIC